MNLKLSRALVMLVRVCFLVALVQGASTWLGYVTPLYVHITFGALMVVALLALALQFRTLNAGLATAAMAVGLLLPAVGLLQLKGLFLTFPWGLDILHLATAFSGIALAEIMAKRIRLSAQPL